LQETDLIQELQLGNAKAFKALVAQYQVPVYHTCFGLVNRSEVAEDLAQEVFVEVYRSIGSYQGKARLSTWLYRIATNKSLEWIRRNQRQKRWAFFSAKRGADSGLLQVEDREAHPGAALENQERSRILFAAIATLAEKQRVAFSLHKIEGLSYQEISEVMEVSLSSVESLMFRAKKNLQLKLRAYYELEKE
jgi:RNA polymerase sigma factor (sigma-70 family)